MEKLSIKNVSKRKRALNRKPKRKDLSLLLNKDKLTLREAQEVIENFESISDNQFYAFEKVLDLFKESYSNGYTCKNDLDVQRLCKSICDIMPYLETTSNPVHDLIITQSRESRNYFKRIMKNSKDYIDRAIDASDGSVSDIGYDNHKKDSKNYPIDFDKYRKTTLKDAPNASNIGPSVTAASTEACYEKIQETAKNIKIYDRVLSNHNKLCKRFNFDTIVNEAKDYELCVYELCQLIDSYDLPFEVKYNVALENVLYLFESNHKFQDENPKELIDEFFLTRDIQPANLTFMETINEQNPFYYEKTNNKTVVNELDCLVEQAKTNPVKEIINDFKKEDNKTIEKAKAMIRKIYTKSPEQIIDGTTNFLEWLRVFIVFSTFAIQPLLGLITLFTDRMLSLHLKRKEIAKVLKSYQSELNKIEKKIDKSNNLNTIERLNKYHDELQAQYDILQSYSDDLKTERELDEDDEINESCLAEGLYDKIGIDELDEIKQIIKFEFDKVLHRIRIASENKYKKYFDFGAFKIISEVEINDFYSFDKELGKYLDHAGNICMSFCKCDMNKLDKVRGTLESLDILEDICSFCKTGLRDNVTIKYEGTGDEMYLIFTYLEPLYVFADMRSEVRENYFHPMTYNSIVNINSISEIFDIMKDYPIEEFKNNLLEMDDINSKDIEYLIEFFKNNSLFSLDESFDILMNLRDNNKTVYKNMNKELINKFIKESVDLEEKEFELETFREDVNSYMMIFEDVKKDKNAKNSKKENISNKAEKFGDSLTKFASKLRYGANTAQLGVQAAKGKGKELSSKEKEISRQIDSTMSTLAKSFEQAAVTKSREQIIKGSILPSASKIIKLAITSGVTWAINPAITVIGGLSMLFISKNATKKERAMILDELDIELKIVERKIARAEAEDDDNVVRDLYKIQNKLLREKQRLKYRMNVYYRQKPISNGKGEE